MERELNRKEQIRQVAQNMFREKGYAATSMRDLANEVGIEAASLYNHIRSKELLLKEICLDTADEFFSAIVKVETQELRADMKLAALIQEHIKVIVTNIDGAAVFLHEWRFLKEPHFSEVKAKRRTYRKKFEAIVNQGVEEGIFKQVDPKIFSLVVLSALNWVYDWFKADGPLSGDDLARQFSYLILEGIKK